VILEPWAVECVGTIALISYWQVRERGVLDSPISGRWCGAVLGNDAVLVARALSKAKTDARCLLLDPTSADLKRAVTVFGRDRVRSVGGERSSLSRSLCLESPDGQRRWILTRSPAPKDDIGQLNADLVYVDYYPELSEYLNQQLVGMDERLRFMVNLSWLSASEEIPILAIRPVVVQASIGEATSIKEAAAYAAKLAEKTGAERAFVTLGARGAVLAVGDAAWHVGTKSRRVGRVMGAGAMFSTEVVIGLANGLDREELLESAVRNASLKVQAASPR